MKKKAGINAICQISGMVYPISELVPGIAIRKPVLELIKQKHPHWNSEGFISNRELNVFRQLNEKMDHLLIYQSQRLLEIQQVQVELMEEIIEKIDRENTDKK